MKRTASILILAGLSAVLSYAQNGEETARLEDHVVFLTSDSLGGRRAGSPGETAAAEYVYDCLYEAGVTMLSGREGMEFSIALEDDTLTSRNVVGIVEGYDDRLKGQYVVIGANMDHLGTNVMTVDGRSVTQIFPGANDNASGIAVMLEVAKRVAASSFFFKRSVVFAGFGAREQGMAGSWYFINKTFPEPDSISIMIDVRSVGRSGPLNPFTYYNGVSSPEVNSLVDGLSEVGAFYIPEEGDGMLPSGDYLPFYEKNIPVVLFTAGSDRNMRTVRDRASFLDYESMDYICDFIYNFIREVANMELMIDRPEEYWTGTADSLASIGGERSYSPYEVDTPPEFFRGDVGTFLREWVYTYLKYPDIPLSQGVSGTVTVEFIVEKDGSVTNVRAVRGNDQYLEDEAVRVISASPKWKPGVLGGEKVRVKYSVPVEFRLKKR